MNRLLQRVKTVLPALSVMLVLAAGCDREPQPASPSSPTQTYNSSTSGSASSGASTTTPANIGQPASQEEKKDGTNPVQGQVDPKQSEQHQDFQQRGDSKGPTGPDTQPKPGG